jgi:hypothetical protein
VGKGHEAAAQRGKRAHVSTAPVKRCPAVEVLGELFLKLLADPDVHDMFPYKAGQVILCVPKETSYHEWCRRVGYPGGSIASGKS